MHAPQSSQAAGEAPGAPAERVAQIRDWLIAAVAERTRLAPAEIKSDEPMYRYGIDSLERVNIAYQLECWIGFEVNEATLAHLETIDEVAAHLARIEAAGAR
ncbi:MAG TPA: acyl carrier protein [Burkholderiales bacterium]